MPIHSLRKQKLPRVETNSPGVVRQVHKNSKDMVRSIQGNKGALCTTLPEAFWKKPVLRTAGRGEEQPEGEPFGKTIFLKIKQLRK